MIIISIISIILIINFLRYKEHMCYKRPLYEIPYRVSNNCFVDIYYKCLHNSNKNFCNNYAERKCVIPITI